MGWTVANILEKFWQKITSLRCYKATTPVKHYKMSNIRKQIKTKKEQSKRLFRT